MQPLTQGIATVARGIDASMAAQSDPQGTDTAKTESGEESMTESQDSTAEAVSGPSGPAGDGKSPDEEPDGRTELPLDQVFEILKNKRRRETLHYLLENGGEASLSDLAEHIAAIENDTTVRAISSSQRKRVYVGLYQCHLPKMDDMDIVDFDQNRGTIELSENVDQLEMYLREPDSRAWYKLYGGIALAGAALFGVAQAGAAEYGLTHSVILFGLLVGIATCALVQAGGFDQLLSQD